MVTIEFPNDEETLAHPRTQKVAPITPKIITNSSIYEPFTKKSNCGRISAPCGSFGLKVPKIPINNDEKLVSIEVKPVSRYKFEWQLWRGKVAEGSFGWLG